MVDDDIIPFVAIGAGEPAPWADLPLSCPNCGGDDLPLRESTPPGLHYITCPQCNGMWLRGEITLPPVPEHVPRSMTRKMAHTDPQAVIYRVFALEAEVERLRAAMSQAIGVITHGDDGTAAVSILADALAHGELKPAVLPDNFGPED